MTVVTEISANKYIGNGVTTEFDYTFRVFSDEHLVVTVTDGNGDSEKRLILNTDYRVTGINSDKGGKIILKSPLVNGNKLLVARDLPAKQDVSFRNQGRFYAEIHENAFDYLTMLVQRVSANLSLFLKRPNMLSNYFDAKNHRIANISQPRNDDDAVNFGLMKSAIRDKDIRSLRVNDIDMPPFPDVATRKNKQIGFDANGKPTLLDPSETGALGYVLVDSFEKGFEITARYQALHYDKDGAYYRWDGQLPKQVSPNSTPDSTGGINVGAWMKVVLDSYTKQEINNALNKKFDKTNVVQTTGNSTTDVISQNGCDKLFAKKDSQELFTARRIHIKSDNDYASLSLIKGNEDKLLFETSPNDVYFAYLDAEGKMKGKINIPYNKKGTLAIQEDNYTKQEVDAKINSARWIVNKSANGWLKEPNTGLVIQWGYRSKEHKEGNSYTINFPTVFSSEVYSITTSSKAHNTTSNTMFVGIAYDVTTRGFNYYVRNVATGNDTFMDGYYWMAIGV